MPFDSTQITSAANRSAPAPAPGDPSHPLAAEAHPPAIAFSVKDYGADAGELAPTLRSGNHDKSLGRALPELPPARAPQAVMAVRRLTPMECERLQGFPDDYTAIPGAKDGPRYRALGNSMAVPVMRWIGHRIALVDAAIRKERAA